MATRTFNIYSDANTSGGGFGTDAGNTKDQHHPVGGGFVGSQVFRAFLKFTTSFSGVASISSATLHLRSTNESHATFGSRRRIGVKRLSSTLANTQGGSSEGVWSTTAHPNRGDEPSVTGNTYTGTMTASNNTWDTVDITTIVQQWLAGSTNYGIRIVGDDEGSSQDQWEFYSKDSAYDPYITIVYTPTVSNTAPTVTPVSPLTGDLAPLTYTAEAGWTAPRVTVTWAFADVDSGDTQTAYQVILKNDSAGSPGSTVYDSTKTAGSDASLVIPYDLTEGSYYHWTVTVWDESDASSSASTSQRFRARWGAAEYVFDTGSTPSAWGDVTAVTDGSVVFEYNSTTNTADPGAGLGTWAASLASVALQRYVRYRVWLMPGTTTPKVYSVVIGYAASSITTADNWSLSANSIIDTTARVFGTRALKTSHSSAEYTSQTVSLRPNTTYLLSAYVKDPDLVGYMSIITGGVTYSVTTSDDTAELVDDDWYRVWLSFTTDASTSGEIRLGISASGTAWFDAVVCSTSSAVVPWHPSTVSGAVILDASGIRIDGSQGGTLRLQGSTAGARDLVELGANGLLLGGDVNLYSGDAQTLNIGDTGIVAGGTTFPTTPTTNLRYFRTDLGMEFFYDGTRWLSTQLFTLTMENFNFAVYATATDSQWKRTFMPDYTSKGGSGIWWEDATLTFYINGGTALSGSHKWVMTTSDGGGTFVTHTIASGSVSAFRQEKVAIGALMNTAVTAPTTAATKTGTPGNIQGHMEITYRLVAT